MGKYIFDLKKSTKGAISVFLILIFLATFALSAVLVDGGRYRMAQAMAETALDTAEESILSYYNQMLYDLYGIFAVDSADVKTDQVAEVLKRYVDQTLGVAEIDYSGYSTMLSNFLLEGDWEAGKDGKYFDDYDFLVNITAGTSVTLASTDYVEDQIIDYMKYRAPIGLAEGAGSFLGKLKAIVNIKDRMMAAKDQIAVTKSHKSLFEKGEKLMNDLNGFNQKMIAYCNNPCVDYDSLVFQESMVDSTAAVSDSQDFNKGNAVDLYEKFGKTLDDELEKIGNYKPEDVPEEFAGVTPSPDDRLKQYQRQEYEKERDEFFESLQPMFGNAERLLAEANALRDRIEGINNEYNQYISELETKMNAKPDSEEYKTVFAPEIELAKGNCGEILKNVDLLLGSRQFTDEIRSLGTGSDGRWTAFETAVGGLLDHRLNGGSPASLKAALNAGEGGNWLSEISIQYFAEVQGNLQALMSQTSYFYKCHKVEINVRNVDEVTAKNEEKQEPKPPADLKEADLQVNYTSASAGVDGQSYSLNGAVKTDEADNLLNAGLSLIDKIAKMLEGVRDNLYVNEYIMTTFPNVVEDKEEPKNLTDLAKKRREYDATYAGVEYILGGQAGALANVLIVDAELLGVRTIFNTAAIFTDTAKRHQASAIAAVISGPFAPLVTIGLLIGWAVAESVTDVVEMKEGKEVALFKTGSDWTISVGGAINKCIGVIADKVAGAISNQLSTVKDNLKKKTSGVIYEVYNSVNSDIESAASAVKDKVAEFGTALGEVSGSLELGGAMGELNGTLSSQINKTKATMANWTASAKDQAIKVVNESVDKAFDKTSDKIKNGLRYVAGDVGEKLQQWMPVGQVVNTGGNSLVKMKYTDYLQIFLLMMNQEKKVQRIQSLIQANMIHGGNAEFRMEKSAASVWADMDCSIRYLFMDNPVLPEGVRRAGRLTFKVHGARAY